MLNNKMLLIHRLMQYLDEELLKEAKRRKKKLVPILKSKLVCFSFFVKILLPQDHHVLQILMQIFYGIIVMINILMLQRLNMYHEDLNFQYNQKLIALH